VGAILLLGAAVRNGLGESKANAAGALYNLTFHNAERNTVIRNGYTQAERFSLIGGIPIPMYICADAAGHKRQLDDDYDDDYDNKPFGRQLGL
jgi:hypothetical protein